MHINSEKTSEVREESWAVGIVGCCSSSSWSIVLSLGWSCEWIEHWLLLSWSLVILSLFFLLLPQLFCLTLLYFLFQCLRHLLNFFNCKFRFNELWFAIKLLMRCFNPLLHFLNLLSRVIFDGFYFSCYSCLNKLWQFSKLILNFRKLFLSSLNYGGKLLNFSLNLSHFNVEIDDLIQRILNFWEIDNVWIVNFWIDKISSWLISVQSM